MIIFAVHGTRACKVLRLILLPKKVLVLLWLQTFFLLLLTVIVGFVYAIFFPFFVSIVINLYMLFAHQLG